MTGSAMSSRSPGPSASSRSDATRARLLDAATAEFAAKGFHGTTTRDIAGAAGMSPAALYVHHRSKEDLLFAICRIGHQHFLDLVRDAARAATDPTARLREIARAFARNHAVEHTLARIVNYELGALSPEHHEEVLRIRLAIEDEVRTVVEAGATEGAFDVPDTGVVTTAILSLGIDIARWYREDGHWDPDRIADWYADLTLRLVGARP
ncbi:TetR/AcrR family transcriptional regulator [Nocardioides panacisoli]|uniref:TetR/AcrR family transcriptional regulator n=1 Tax=Nocardioides panacisoli TaxID=627624 RepID=UPI001C628A25|nr:TetR/AcrR family transcriptional regulator [Nocardioides panacisoli]QYJ02569.1 TetR/AcrR family transcriptional regulator [Nocardioides panacisoli]